MPHELQERMRSDERDFCKSFFKVLHALNFCQGRCHPRDSKKKKKRENTGSHDPTDVVACENIRFSSLFAAGDVSSARNVSSGEERGETNVFAGY